jgi:hypothetical protein
VDEANNNATAAQQDPPIAKHQPNEADPPDQEPDENPDLLPPNPPVNMAEAAPPAFALTPAAAHQDILDYSRPEPAKLFRAAIAPLEGDAYDGTPENLKGFLDRLKAADYTWLGTVLTIQVDAGPPVISRNLIEDYGNISLE